MKAIERWNHACVRCGNCKYVFKEYIDSCPSGSEFKFESYYASGRIRIAQGISRGELAWSADLLDPIFVCTTCGACENQCLAPHHDSIVDIIEDLRADAVQSLGVLERHHKFETSIEQNHNPYGESHHAREMKLLHDLPDTAKYVYFIGCTANYREKQIRDATISVLKKLGIDFTIVDEFCCGSPLLRTGQRQLAPSLASHNVQQIEATGAQKVITSCAGCFRTIKRDYPKMDLEYDFDVLHITEFLEELITAGNLKLRSTEGIVYAWHDPCHLGRHMQVYDAPRKVMSASSIDYVEMDPNLENAWCCGAGGGARAAYSDWSLETAKKRISQIPGTTNIVTACPFCVRNLRDASPDDYAVVDIIEIVDRLL